MERGAFVAAGKKCKMKVQGTGKKRKGCIKNWLNTLQSFWLIDFKFFRIPIPCTIYTFVCLNIYSFQFLEFSSLCLFC